MINQNRTARSSVITFSPSSTNSAWGVRGFDPDPVKGPEASWHCIHVRYVLVSAQGQSGLE